MPKRVVQSPCNSRASCYFDTILRTDFMDSWPIIIFLSMSRFLFLFLFLYYLLFLFSGSIWLTKVASIIFWVHVLISHIISCHMHLAVLASESQHYGCQESGGGWMDSGWFFWLESVSCITVSVSALTVLIGCRKGIWPMIYLLKVSLEIFFLGPGPATRVLVQKRRPIVVVVGVVLFHNRWRTSTWDETCSHRFTWKVAVKQKL